MVDRPGIEPGIEACKATVFPSIPTAHSFTKVYLISLAQPSNAIAPEANTL